MSSTRVARTIKASRKAVYRAFLDPAALNAWLPPDGMKGRIHDFDARQGGGYRMSLTYLDPDGSMGGKTTEDTDTVRSQFVELAPDEKIVQLVEFESADPAFAGQMTMTTTLEERDGGTEVIMLCEGIPEGIKPEDNEAGSKMSLRNLAKLLE